MIVELHVVSIYEGDEPFLAPFLEAWRKVNPSASIMMANDSRRPASNIPDSIPQIPTDWNFAENKSVAMLKTLARAVELIPCDRVVKCDVDCLHLSRKWLDQYHSEDVVACGHQHNQDPSAFFGACYWISASVVAKVLAVADNKVGRNFEDQGVSRQVRRVYCNGVFLHSERYSKRLGGMATPRRKWSSLELLHFGEFGKSYRLRKLGASKMAEYLQTLQ